MTEYAALIGIDWSDAKHDVCLIDTASPQRCLHAQLDGRSPLMPGVRRL